MRPLQRSRRDGRPLPVQVYEQLRDLIVDGELAADSQLVQEQVAESMGVSRTPVRDALNRLVHEGLVTWLPGQGYLINGLTDQEIVEVFQVRRALEMEATRLAAGRHDAAAISRLRALIEEMAVADPEDAALLFDLNRRFHRALVTPCGNKLLLNMLDTLWNHPVNRRITRSYLHGAGSSARMIEEHRELLEAAATHEGERMLALTEHHLTTGYGETSPAIDQLEGDS